MVDKEWNCRFVLIHSDNWFHKDNVKLYESFISKDEAIQWGDSQMREFIDPESVPIKYADNPNPNTYTKIWEFANLRAMYWVSKSQPPEGFF